MAGTQLLGPSHTGSQSALAGSWNWKQEARIGTGSQALSYDMQLSQVVSYLVRQTPAPQGVHGFTMGQMWACRYSGVIQWLRCHIFHLSRKGKSVVNSFFFGFDCLPGKDFMLLFAQQLGAGPGCVLLPLLDQGAQRS